MSNPILTRLLKRYTSGKANKAERFVVDRWYDSFKEFGDLTPGIETPQKAISKQEKMYLKIIADRRTAKPWYLRPEFSIAASLLIIATLTFIFYPGKHSQRDLVIYHTEKGKTQTVTLPDSTVVWMNAGSELRVLVGYGKTLRKVSLQGEAYFQVKHNKAVPFIIATERLNTQVLGTSFNVSAYKNLPGIEVVVRTGKVSVSNGNKLLGMLTPDQAILYDKQTNSATINTQDAEARIAWRMGKTMLNNASFGELTERFDNSFNVRLVTKNTFISALRFRLMLDKTLPLEENLNVITDIHQLKYRRINAHEIELYRK